MFNELACADCNISFSSAALLLKHFAQHVNRDVSKIEDNQRDQIESCKDAKKTNIPDLYPISSLKTALKKKDYNKGEMSMTLDDNEENIDSGIEDANPFRYCVVSMPVVDNEDVINFSKLKSTCSRKYKCSYCSKTFGWSTDLKRHTLTHTGERPFKCTICDSTFTRKFLLQKHQNKQHDIRFVYSTLIKNKVKVPPLKPIGNIFKKSRKQDKQKIKRKIFNIKNY